MITNNSKKLFIIILSKETLALRDRGQAYTGQFKVTGDAGLGGRFTTLSCFITYNDVTY